MLWTLELNLQDLLQIMNKFRQTNRVNQLEAAPLEMIVKLNTEADNLDSQLHLDHNTDRQISSIQEVWIRKAVETQIKIIQDQNKAIYLNSTWIKACIVVKINKIVKTKIGLQVQTKAQAEFKTQEQQIVDSAADNSNHLIKAAELDRCQKDNRIKWWSQATMRWMILNDLKTVK